MATENGAVGLGMQKSTDKAPNSATDEGPPAAEKHPGSPDPKKDPDLSTLKKDAEAPAPEKGDGVPVQPSTSSQGPEAEADQGGGPAEGNAGQPAALPQPTETAEASAKKPSAEQGPLGSQAPGEPTVGRKAAECQAAARRGSPAFLHSPSCPAILSSSEKLLVTEPLSEASELIFEGVPVTPGPPDPGLANAGEKNIVAGSREEAGEKAPGQPGQDKVQGDTSRGIEFQAVPSARPLPAPRRGAAARKHQQRIQLELQGGAGRGQVWSSLYLHRESHRPQAGSQSHQETDPQRQGNGDAGD